MSQSIQTADGTNSAPEQPKLDKPGAGLPFIEWAVAKYIIFPRHFKNTTVEQAIDGADRLSKKIIAVTEPLDIATLSERRLVPRLRGLEDSSRYWSVAMTLQHLIIVNLSMQRVITSLSQGKSIDRKASIADLKPAPDIDASTVREKFQKSSEALLEDLRSCDFTSAESKIQKFEHPWFGPLNAEQWLKFAAPHTKIHADQISEILKRIK